MQDTELYRHLLGIAAPWAATKVELRISWDEAWHILERAIARGMKVKKSRISTHLGVDELARAISGRASTCRNHGVTSAPRHGVTG